MEVAANLGAFAFPQRAEQSEETQKDEPHLRDMSTEGPTAEEGRSPTWEGTHLSKIGPWALLRSPVMGYEATRGLPSGAMCNFNKSSFR